MEVRKYPARVTFGQIGDLRLWLWIVVLPAVTLSWVIPTWRELGVGATEGARPIGQLAQDDLSAPVWSLSFSSDGAYLASATVTGDVWLKETLSGRVIRLGRGPTGSVQCLAFAPTTHVLAVAGIDPALRLWDVDTGKELAPLGIEARFAKYVAFSTDGTTLAVSLRGFHWDEGIIMLWDWRQARQLATLEGHRGDVNVLSFSAGGSRLASGDAHGVVKIWDLEAYRERSSFQANQRGGPIQAVAFTPDGTNVVTAAFCEGHVRLWDASLGRPRGEIPAMANAVNALAFLHDGQTLAMAGDEGNVALWDVLRRQEVGFLKTHGATFQSLALAPDRHQIATGGVDGAIRLWDLKRAASITRDVSPSDVER